MGIEDFARFYRYLFIAGQVGVIGPLNGFQLAALKGVFEMTITSKDVRRLKVCSACGELGIYQPEKSEVEIPLVICTNVLRTSGAVADYQHVECYSSGSITKLMILPKSELDAIRISDVSKKAMQGILVARRAK